MGNLTLEQIFTSTLVYSVALTLIHFLWQGLLVSLVLKLVFALTPKRNAQWRYALASLAMTANLVIPVITFFIIYQSAQIPAQSAQVLAIIKDLTTSRQGTVNPYQYFDLVGLLPYVSIVWFVMVTCLAAKLLIEVNMVNRLPKQANMHASPALAARFEQLTQQIKLTRPVRLLISINIDVPMAIGWLRPVVLLPATMMSGLSTAQLEMLLLHELAHIRRHDYLVNFIQTLVEILMFFHPSVLWVSSQMRHEREHCSDDIAVQYCGDPVAYAHTLADTAALCKRHPLSAPDLAMAATGGDLKKRVIRLVGQHYTCGSKRTKGIATAMVAVTMLLLISQQSLTLVLRGLPVAHFPLIQGIDPATSMTAYTFAENKHANQDTTSIAHRLLSSGSAQTNQRSSAQQLALIEPSASGYAIDRATQSNLQQATVSSVVSKLATENDKLAIHQEMLADETILVQTNPLMVKKGNRALQTRDPLITVHANSLDNNPYAGQLTTLSQQYSTFDYPIEDTTSAEQVAINFPSASQVLNHKVGERATPHNQSALLVSSTDPKYPVRAKRKGLELEVEINFTIDVQGKVTNIEFPHHGKTNYFKRSIRMALNKWSFLPAQIDGQAVESKMTKIFKFSLV